MDQPSRRLSRTAWAGIFFTFALLVLAFGLAKMQSRLGANRGPLPVYSQVGAFALTNQQGRGVTLADLRGQVWVADIIFTRCAGPCPRMTRQMAELQAHLPAGQPVKLVSLTTDPDFDHPDVLRRYAGKFGAQDNRWWFLTGTKSELGRLAIDGLKLTATEKKPGERNGDNDLFVHSTIFAVVDKAGRLRAVFETQPRLDDNGEPEVDSKKLWHDSRTRILAAVNQLLAEDQDSTM